MRYVAVILLLIAGCSSQAQFKAQIEAKNRMIAELEAKVVDLSRKVSQTQQGNNNRITNTDPVSLGISLGAVVAVVGIIYGVGRVHGIRNYRVKALRGNR